MGIGGAGIPGPDYPVSTVDACLVFATNHRDGEIDRLKRLLISAVLNLGFRVLQAPAGTAILLTGPGWRCFPCLRDADLLDSSGLSPAFSSRF